MVLLQRYRVLMRCFILLAAFTLSAAAQTVPIKLTPEEVAWIAENQGRTFTVGFDPFAGMDSFEFRGRRIGFLHELLPDMQKHLGVAFALADVAGWDDAYSRFVAGKIDVLYGANPTPERERIMTFSRPVLRLPYVVLARKDSAVQTIGDLDGRRVGFIANDFVSGQLPAEYPNIHLAKTEYPDQGQALAALASGAVDGFITSGGGIEYEYLYDHADLAVVAQVRGITSDMTLAVLKSDDVLGRILDKYVDQYRGRIGELARDTARIYNRKILRLSDAELDWLERNGEAIVGVAEDYLPFDYYHDGRYKGIVGETLNRIADLVGMRVKVVSGHFAEIYEKARNGAIDVLNIAKTEDRQRYFLYPRPISTERDIIVGRKSSPPIQDVYGLEGYRVAVVDGFWHDEYLRKNLRTPQIVTTADIRESLRLVRDGKADYMIENPTVVEFYINGLGYTDLVKRGNTSKDSFVYFGVNSNRPELAGIIDKALTLIDFEAAKYAGIQSVPTLRNEESRRLGLIVAGLALALMAILVVTMRIVYASAQHKAQAQILRERETLLYTDPLTGFFNRNYFSHNAETLRHGRYPQALVVADLNNLKRVNDANGHAAGDALIRLFAQCMREQFPGAMFFRIGGDEFLALVDRVTEDEIVDGIAALEDRCSMAGHVLPADGATISPSAAIGYAMRLADDDSLDAAMAVADERMYQVKALAKKRRTDDA